MKNDHDPYEFDDSPYARNGTTFERVAATIADLERSSGRENITAGLPPSHPYSGLGHALEQRTQTTPRLLKSPPAAQNSSAGFTRTIIRKVKRFIQERFGDSLQRPPVEANQPNSTFRNEGDSSRNAALHLLNAGRESHRSSGRSDNNFVTNIPEASPQRYIRRLQQPHAGVSYLGHPPGNSIGLAELLHARRQANSFPVRRDENFITNIHEAGSPPSIRRLQDRGAASTTKSQMILPSEKTERFLTGEAPPSYTASEAAARLGQPAQAPEIVRRELTSASRARNDLANNPRERSSAYSR